MTDKYPDSIQRLIDGKTGMNDSIGMSDAEIIMYDDCVLKILPYRSEIDESVNMMKWLSDRLPTPKVLAYEVKDSIGYLLMSRIDGVMACDEYYLDHPKEMLSLLAEGLKMLWGTPIDGCPRVRDLSTELKEARYRIANNTVDLTDSEPQTFGDNGFANPEELYQWLLNNKPKYEPVLSHGDYCLPNVFFKDGKVSGFIDLGDCGVGDKWRDIALCYRSLIHNFGGFYGGKVYEDFNPDDLFAALDIPKNEEKLKYYILLDELF